MAATRAAAAAVVAETCIVEFGQEARGETSAEAEAGFPGSLLYLPRAISFCYLWPASGGREREENQLAEPGDDVWFSGEIRLKLVLAA